VREGQVGRGVAVDAGDGRHGGVQGVRERRPRPQAHLRPLSESVREVRGSHGGRQRALVEWPEFGERSQWLDELLCGAQQVV